jgi:MHS family citrate/tricarballylate:H+ symporter-like MFS transporter
MEERPPWARLASRRPKIVLRVTTGKLLEMYDFFLFGIYARQIAQTFFPSDDPYALARW